MEEAEVEPKNSSLFLVAFIYSYISYGVLQKVCGKENEKKLFCTPPNIKIHVVFSKYTSPLTSDDHLHVGFSKKKM